VSLFSFPLPARARGDVRRQSASTMNERRCGRRRRRRRRRRRSVYARVFSLSFCVVIFAPICFIFSARQTSVCKVVGGVLELRDADKHTHTRAKRDNFKPAAPHHQHTHRYISSQKKSNHHAESKAWHLRDEQKVTLGQHASHSSTLGRVQRV